MARKEVVTVEYIDDLDGGKAEGTVKFAFDGKSYEIDLSKKNKAAFQRAVKPFLDAARPVREQRANASRAASKGRRRSDLADIREWARTQKDLPEVADRGRIPKSVVEAYDAR